MSVYIFKIEEKRNKCIKKRLVYVFKNRKDVTIIIVNLKTDEYNFSNFN